MGHLPAEIVLAIADEVTGLKYRLRLLQVCRSWRALLLQTVYRSVRVYGPQIKPLLQAVSINPLIGNSIRQLHVGPWGMPQHGDSRLDLGPAANELIAQCTSEWLGEWEEWSVALGKGSDDVHLALLLALLPNLTVLYGDYDQNAPYTSRLICKAAAREGPFNTRPILQHLTTVDFTTEDNREAYHHSLFLPIFHLPSIRDVTLESVKDHEEVIQMGDHDPRQDYPTMRPLLGTSTVESLVLDTQCNGRYGIRELIISCANLKRFIYQHDEQVLWGVRYSSFRPREFRAPLLTQKHSLEVLHLGHEGDTDCSADDSEDEDDHEPYNRWIGSLADFQSLYDLRIRVDNLLNFHPKDSHETVTLKEILPASLRWLHISDCDEGHCGVLIPNLQNLLDHREGRFLNLEQVLIYSRVAETLEPQPRLLAARATPADIRVAASFRERLVATQELYDRTGVKFDICLGGGYTIQYVNQRR